MARLTRVKSGRSLTKIYSESPVGIFSKYSESAFEVDVKAAKKLILVVEDDFKTALTLCWLLEAHGYNCISATSVDQALQVFRNNEVDLVISDYIIAQEGRVRFAWSIKEIKPVPLRSRCAPHLYRGSAFASEQSINRLVVMCNHRA